MAEKRLGLEFRRSFILGHKKCGNGLRYVTFSLPCVVFHNGRKKKSRVIGFTIKTMWFFVEKKKNRSYLCSLPSNYVRREFKQSLGKKWDFFYACKTCEQCLFGKTRNNRQVTSKKVKREYGHGNQKW